MLTRRVLAVAFPVALLVLATGGAAAQEGGPEEKSFESADGARLRGLFYRAEKGGGSAPTVLMLHEYKGNPNDPVWNDTAKLLAKLGYNVLQFDFRGHGKSTDVVADKFWDSRTLWGQFNLANIQVQKGKAALKSNISVKEFERGYYPMLVQDIAAARNLLDVMNDSGEVNTSTIYLLGTGDSVNLGMLFVASEWLRERKKPNVAVAADFVSTRRALFPGADPAGPDIGGAIWLSPMAPPYSGMSSQTLNKLVISPQSYKMRNDTPMLFVHGEKDQKGSTYARLLLNSVLQVNSTTGPGGVKMPKPEQTFVRPIKGSAAAGTKLLGNNLGTEKLIEDFLAAVDKERRQKPRKTTDWDKPLYIEFTSFGVR